VLGATGHCRAARWHARGVWVGANPRVAGASKWFALQIDQFLVKIVALGVQRRKLRLRLGQLGLELHLCGEQIGQYPTELITLRTYGDQLCIYRRQVGLEPSDDGGQARPTESRDRLWLQNASAAWSIARISGALEQC
jgi:hypothetical protein